MGTASTVGTNDKKVTVTLTRPADTAAYAAKDAVSNSTSAPVNLTFAALGAGGGGSGKITAAMLATTDTNAVRYRLHLWTAAPVAINDNAAYVRDKDTLLASYVGHITFAPAQLEGVGDEFLWDQQTSLFLPFTTAADGIALFGQLEVLDAISTSVSAAIFTITLWAERNPG